VIHRKTKLINLYIPFSYAGDKIGVAAIALYMIDIDKQMNYLYRQCVVIALIIVAIHFGFAVLFSRMIFFPLRKLNDATHLLAQGKLDIRVPIVSDDEIGQLASSFNEMSVALQRMRDEARGANPLTGLPGNLAIAKFIDDSLNAGRVICVLYCDLDNFKAYNDKYGFTKGDEAILYTRDCLVAIAKRKDMKDVFIGHEGGDDFVVVCEFPYWEEYAKSFITLFDRGIYQFYNSVDARNGFIESINRRGERQRFPLMSVSVAVVSNRQRPFRRHAEMIQVAAEVKKYVKSIDGSCYAIDRRQGPVSPTGQVTLPGQAHAAPG
jgi:GGDEF domain-containing protein